jgi:nicotinamidase-related amidase
MQYLSPNQEAAAGADATLVVIDMQPDCFLYARWMINPVVAQMREAARQGQGVVLVQYVVGLADEIAPQVLQAYTEFSRRALAVKTQEDGSAEVLAACMDAGLSTNRFRICGVTTDDCVTRTAHGLARLCPAARIEVIKSACECWQGNRFDWSNFSHLPNVVPV